MDKNDYSSRLPFLQNEKIIFSLLQGFGNPQLKYTVLLSQAGMGMLDLSLLGKEPMKSQSSQQRLWDLNLLLLDRSIM